MNDMRDLFCGFIGAVATVALYIFAWSAMQTCFGAEADEYKYTPYFPQSDERVVISDQQYVVIAASDWERWTNAVARLEAVAERRWANEHKTDAGRRAWHGALKDKHQAEDGRGMVYVYADGFTYTEEAPAQRRESPAVRRMKQGQSQSRPAQPVARNAVPTALQKKRDAILARPAAKEVKATFGPGGKVISVEDK